MRHNTLQIRPQEKLETHEWLEIDSFCSSTRDRFKRNVASMSILYSSNGTRVDIEPTRAHSIELKSSKKYIIMYNNLLYIKRKYSNLLPCMLWMRLFLPI
jgi:hypothetical protein